MSDKGQDPKTGNGGGGAGGADGGNGSAPPPKKANPFEGVSFAIEFGSDCNNNTLCPITRRVYRGKWVASNVKGRVADDWFNRMPDLPGHMIVVDGANRTVTFVDPLESPEYRDTLKEAQDVLKGRGWGDEPDEREDLKSLSDDDLKNWIYWCRRWVDNSQAEAIRGTRVPTMEQVVGLPGQVRYNQFEMHEDRAEHPDMKRIPPYRVPVKPRERKLKRQKRNRDD